MVCKTLQLQEEEDEVMKHRRMKLMDMEIVIYTCQVLTAFLFPLLRVSMEESFQQTIKITISTEQYFIMQYLFFCFRVRLINLTSTFYKKSLFYFEYLLLDYTRSENLH